MPSITQKRLRQIIAEEVKATVEDNSANERKMVPAISTAASNFLDALMTFKEKCPADCLSSVSGLEQLEKTLENMFMHPGDYLPRAARPSVRDDVQELMPKEPEEPEESEED
jgi:hypothetical protein